MKTFKRFLASMLCAVIVLTAAPLSGFVGLKFPEINFPEWNLFDFNIKSEAFTDGVYTYEVTDGQATITDCNTSISGDLVISSTLGGYPVTRIGSYAFENCTGLTTIEIPDRVTSIGNGAFYKCTGLTNVYYTGDIESWCGIEFYNFYSNPMYYADNFYINDTLVKQIEIPDTVTKIKDYAFTSFERIFSVSIPDNVTSIGMKAFSNCSRLFAVTIGAGVTSMGKDVFYNCTNLASVTIGNGVINIGSSAFKDCSSLASIIIPDSVTSIDSSAFYGCSSLTSVTIGNGVINIGSSAFEDCSSLASIIIPDSVTSIDSSAFYGCSSLTSVTIPDSVTSIGGGAFYGCSSLTSVTIGKGVINIGSYAFEDCTSLTNVYYTGDIALWCGIEFVTRDANPMSNAENFYINNTLVGEVIIPDIVTEIKNFAFYSFDRITSVTIPDSVTSIGGNAFQECKNLTSVTIGYGVESMGYYAFGYCSKLKTVTIHRVKHIEDFAFLGCTSLEMITIPRSVTSIDEYAFHLCSSIKYVAYSGTKEDWKKISIGSDNDYFTSARIIFGVYSLQYIVENGVKYLVTDKFAEIISASKTPSEVVIPEKINDKPVTQINAYAFRNCYSLASITIPDSVNRIVAGAFYGCSNLTSITIPDSVNEIDAETFYGCSNLASIIIPDSVTSIGKEAFYRCKSLTSIIIPDSVTSIDSSAFYGCLSLTSVTIPGSVTSIARNMFYQCTSLTSIIIPDSVKSIGYSAFYGCTGLTSVTIPDSVESIGSYAFSGCTSLTSIIIPDGVKSIQYSTFQYCANLERITIPSTVEYIHESAFEDCSKLSKVFYDSIELEWKSISVGSYNEPLESATKYYNHVHGYNEIVDIPSTCQTQGRNFLVCECGETFGYVTAPLLKHSMGESEKTKDPTCSEKGQISCKCTVCGQTYIEEIDTVPHTPGALVEENRTEPTCTGEGSCDSVVYCSVCKAELSRETTVFTAMGHEKIITLETAATCTETGMRYYKCSVCGYDGVNEKVYSTSECPQSSHNYSDMTIATRSFSAPGATKLILKFSSSTNTERGKDYIYIYNKDGSLYGKYSGTQLSGKIIELDGDGFSIKLASDSCINYYGYSFDSITAVYPYSDDYREVVPALGHTEAEPVEENRTEATCTQDGSYDTVVYCTVCENEVSRETTAIPALGHIEAELVEENRVEVTCTRDGSYDTVVYCTTCKGEVSRETTVIPATGHEYVSEVTVPTCTEQGYTTYTCSVCGDTYVSDEVEALGHTLGEAVEENKVDSTCTEKGSYESVVYCSVCGEELSRETKSIPAKGHKFGAWKVTKEPTMTTDGVKVRECSVCGETETGVEPKTGITITLSDFEGKVVSETVVEGNVTSYSFLDIADGEYTVTVSKETYVSREYTIAVTDGETAVEFKLNHIGDINGDGKVNTMDVARANASAKGTSSLSGYEFACADINGDGKVNTMDVARMNAHAKGVSTLW